MKALFRAAAVFAVLSLPFSASAQSYRSYDPLSDQERRATVGITIPFGQGGTQSERKPRLELALDHRQHDLNGLEIGDFASFKSQRPFRLGLTLSDKPQMMLNGREMPENDNRKNISDGVWIGGGVAVVLGIGFYLMATGQLSGPTD